MIEKEKKAIEYLKGYKYQNEVSEAIDIVLNLIQKQQEEIEKKDKIIDLIADFISKYHCFEISVFDIDNECKYEHNCKDCIKQYFERKVEEKKNVK